MTPAVTAAVHHVIQVDAERSATDAARRKQALDALLERDPEGWSCLQGLMAMLKLHLTVEGRQHIEIDRGGMLGWMPIDRVEITDGMITYTKGRNGHSELFHIECGRQVPRWRIAAGPTTAQIPHYI